MEEEIWHTIKGFENYEVSNFGRVRSKDIIYKKVSKYGKEYEVSYKGKILSFKDIRGYKNVGLSIRGKRQPITRQVHRLVMETFNPVEGMENLQVNHKDLDKSNNRIDNLEWVTPSENMQHASRHNRLWINNQCGENNKMSKLTHEDVTKIKSLLDSHSDKEIAIMFGVCRQNINNIRLSKTWKD